MARVVFFCPPKSILWSNLCWVWNTIWNLYAFFYWLLGQFLARNFQLSTRNFWPGNLYLWYV